MRFVKRFPYGAAYSAVDDDPLAGIANLFDESVAFTGQCRGQVNGFGIARAGIQPAESRTFRRVTRDHGKGPGARGQRHNEDLRSRRRHLGRGRHGGHGHLPFLDGLAA